MTDTWASPASSTGIEWKSALGHLLLISPLEYVEKVNTSLGEKDAIRADIVDLDSGEEYSDILVFPRVLQGQLRSRIGQKVLGRLTQGAAKVGQSPPWKLDEATAEDGKKATAYLTKTVSADQPPF